MATKGHKPSAKAPAKKKPLPGDRPDIRRFYLILAIVAVVGVGWIGYSVINRGGGSAAMAPIQLTGIDNPQELLKQA